MDSTDDIEQAVLAAKWQGAKKNMAEALADVFDVPEYKVRDMFAAFRYLNSLDVEDTYIGYEGDSAAHQAMKQNILRELRRMKVRKAIERNEPLSIPTGLLYKTKPRGTAVCNGCPVSMACAGLSISTPQACWRSGFVKHYYVYENRTTSITRFRKKTLRAQPLRIVDGNVELRVEHPPGDHTIRLSEVPL